ncbi:Pentatricopeptide repeat-containing protein At2g31400 [Durusdinium trenchii]|uniref:Chloroplastic n=1 Tax=Durusdinium trenchii TaxID=1381693 RepID=A0ABP0IV85_9DINO
MVGPPRSCDTVSVLNQLAQRRQQAVKHMEAIRQQAVDLNKFSYTAALSACEKGYQWRMAEELLLEMPRRKVSCDMICCNALMSACASSGEWKEALHWLCTMLHRDPISYTDSIASRGYNAAISACQLEGEWPVAVALLAEMSDMRLPPVSASHMAEASFERKRDRPTEALKTVRLTSEPLMLEFSLDVMSFTSLLGGCGTPSTWSMAQSVLAHMQSEAIEGDIVSANAAGNVSAQGGRWENAWSLFEDSCRQSIQADQGLVSAILSGTRADEDPQSWIFAVDLLGGMEERGLVPGVVSRSNVLAACGCTAWTAALQILDGDLDLDLICHTMTINAWQSVRRWQEALVLFDALPCRRFPPDGFAHVAGLASKRRGSWSSAGRLLHSLQDRWVEATVHSHGAAMSLLARDGHWQKSLDFLSCGHARRMALTVSAAKSSAVNACKEVGDWSQALSLLWEMSTSDEKILQFSWGAAISACRSEWILAAELLCKMFTASLQVEMVSSTAAAAAALAESWRIAVSMLSSSHRLRMDMDEKSFLLAFNGLRNSQQCMDVLEDFDDLVSRSVSFRPWALASSASRDPGALHAAFVEAADRIEKEVVEPMELASLWWATSVVGAKNRKWTQILSQRALEQIHQFTFDELLVVIWGACGTACDAVVQLCFQKEMADRLANFEWSHLPARFGQRVALDALGSLWACTYSGTLTGEASQWIRSSLSRLGGQLDGGPSAHGCRAPAAVPEDLHVTAPHIVMDTGDRVVLFKPPDWEVHDANAELQLASFMEAMFGKLPILRDEAHEHGFLHRLDVPSSGLILAAKSFEAYYDLQDYLVLCHGWMEAHLSEITAQVVIEDGGRTVSGGRGKPTLTHVKVLAHARHPSSKMSLLVIRPLDAPSGRRVVGEKGRSWSAAPGGCGRGIGTGRRHQIRSHLAHLGHPSATWREPEGLTLKKV